MKKYEDFDAIVAYDLVICYHQIIKICGSGYVNVFQWN